MVTQMRTSPSIREISLIFAYYHTTFQISKFRSLLPVLFLTGSSFTSSPQFTFPSHFCFLLAPPIHPGGPHELRKPPETHTWECWELGAGFCAKVWNYGSRERVGVLPWRVHIVGPWGRDGGVPWAGEGRAATTVGSRTFRSRRERR